MGKKVVVFGAKESGKTALISRLIHDAFNEDYRATLGLEVHSLEDEIQVLETTNDSRFQKHTVQAYKRANLGVFCVDGSENPELDAINANIRAFKEINPNVPIFLVITKSDKSTAFKNEIKSLQKKLGCECFFTSARNERPEELLQAILNQFKANNNAQEQLKADNKKVDEINEVLNRIAALGAEYSKLHQALCFLETSTKHFPRKQKKIIGLEMNRLIDDLQNSNLEDKTESIQRFLNNCKQQIDSLEPRFSAADARRAGLKIGGTMAGVALVVTGVVIFSIFSPPGLIFDAFFIAALVLTAITILIAAGITYDNTSTIIDYYESNNRFFKTPSKAVKGAVQQVESLADVLAGDVFEDEGTSSQPS